MGIENCVVSYGRTFCWNPENESLEEIIRKPVKISEIPEDAALALMKLGFTKKR